MMENAARARKWLLWSAPVTALAGILGRAGGAGAGLMLWLFVGGALSRKKRAAILYPKQRRPARSRVFLAWGLCAFLMTGGAALGKSLLPGGGFAPVSVRCLFWLGASCGSAALGSRLISARLSRRFAGVGGLFCWAAAALFSLL